MKRVGFALFGLLLAFVAIAGITYLLYGSKITSQEFVVLVISFSVMALVVCFAPEVQEISIAGNVLKLREIKSEAEKSIEQLRKAQAQFFRFMLRTGVIYSGVYSPLGSPERFISNDFWELLEECRETGCLKAVRDDLLKAIDGSLVRMSSGIGAIRDDGLQLDLRHDMSDWEIRMAIGEPDMDVVNRTWNTEKIDRKMFDRFINVIVKEYLKLATVRNEISRL
ncbi:hypothetical protein [Pseudomonas sp. B15(2017)]|uniref:hypothetical protein n=1 Tax=Pseudomonas sp. B15(2017) TaxID=1981744 RepID=UPI00111BE8A8|nr:hypothetical protein [Pseudomonas sp. B15(2017)]